MTKKKQQLFMYFTSTPIDSREMSNTQNEANSYRARVTPVNLFWCTLYLYFSLTVLDRLVPICSGT